MSNAAMATPLSVVDTHHEDMIHDAQLDYYAKRLATCSSDRTIRVYDVSGEQQQELAQLRGHDGSVWQVAWAHPRFGVILASCSYDSKVLLFRETSPNTFEQIYEHAVHDASVNSIAWAPHEFGHLCLACASSDGKISVLTHNTESGQWTSDVISDNSLGCNSVSWAPYNSLGKEPCKKLVTGSCDNAVRIWKINSVGKWENEPQENMKDEHQDWVRDVAWAPSTGLPSNLIATCSEDGQVIMWSQTEIDGQWTAKKLERMAFPVWRVSWSTTGNVLAVSSGDHKVTLWKESVDKPGEWVQISEVNEGARN